MGVTIKVGCVETHQKLITKLITHSTAYLKTRQRLQPC